MKRIFLLEFQFGENLSFWQQTHEASRTNCAKYGEGMNVAYQASSLKGIFLQLSSSYTHVKKDRARLGELVSLNHTNNLQNTAVMSFMFWRYGADDLSFLLELVANNMHATNRLKP